MAAFSVVALIVWLLLGSRSRVVLPQETMDMSAWQDENPKMAAHCECQAKRNALEEEHLRTIRAIIEDVREMHTDCSSHTDRVEGLKKQNKYLLDKVQYLEHDVTHLDHELQVLTHTSHKPQGRVPDVVQDAAADYNGSSSKCQRHLSCNTEAVSGLPATSMTLQEMANVTRLNTGEDRYNLSKRVAKLEKINRNRKRKLRLLTKKDEQQRKALKIMERRLQGQVTSLSDVKRHNAEENEKLKERVRELSKTLRKLERVVEGLEDRRRHKQEEQGVVGSLTRRGL